MTAEGFNEGQNYTSKDVRYVTKDGKIYATIMAWPNSGKYILKSLLTAFRITTVENSRPEYDKLQEIVRG